MKKILTALAILFCFTIKAQTTSLTLTSGVLEESNKRGISVASVIGLNQEIQNGFGVGVEYTYAIMKRYDNFQQLQLNVFQVFDIDETLGISFNAGAVRQVSGKIYPTFGGDILVYASDKVAIDLGWQPVVRGKFRDPNTGWSMATTIGVMLKLK